MQTLGWFPTLRYRPFLAALAVAASLFFFPAAASAVELIEVSLTTNPITPDGDGQNDVAQFMFTLDQPANVSIEINSFRGREKLITRTQMFPAGTSTIGWTGTDDRGKVLPTGNFRFLLRAASSGSQRTFAGMVRVESKVSFSAFFANKLASGLPPVSVTPSAISPNGDKINDLAVFRLSLDEPSRVTIEIFSFSGREKLLVDDRLVRAGLSTIAWTGSDDAGKVLRPGNYRFQVKSVSGKGQRTFSGIVGVRSREAELRGREPELRGPEPEVRGREPEVRGREPEVRGPEPEQRGQEPEPGRGSGEP